VRQNELAWDDEAKQDRLFTDHQNEHVLFAEEICPHCEDDGQAIAVILGMDWNDIQLDTEARFEPDIFGTVSQQRYRNGRYRNPRA
jgi:hypothetical protein